MKQPWGLRFARATSPLPDQAQMNHHLATRAAARADGSQTPNAEVI